MDEQPFAGMVKSSFAQFLEAPALHIGVDFSRRRVASNDEWLRSDDGRASCGANYAYQPDIVIEDSIVGTKAIQIFARCGSGRIVMVSKAESQVSIGPGPFSDSTRGFIEPDRMLSLGDIGKWKT